MDPRARATSELVKILLKQGLIIFSSTAASGITLGPTGLLIGSAAGGAAATVLTVMETSSWRYIASAVTGFVLSVLPNVFSMEYVKNMLRAVARLVVRMLRSAGFLPASELHRAIAYQPERRPDRDDEPGSAY